MLHIIFFSFYKGAFINYDTNLRGGGGGGQTSVVFAKPGLSNSNFFTRDGGGGPFGPGDLILCNYGVMGYGEGVYVFINSR